MIARHGKVHFFDYKKGDESLNEAQTTLPGKQTTSIDYHFGMVGLSICYDLRFPKLYRALLPVDLILVPAAFTALTGQAHWETSLRARAIKSQAYVLAPAQGGAHPSGRERGGIPC